MGSMLKLCLLMHHLGWRSWSPDTILKVYYPRTIHAMSALNADWFQKRRLLNNFPIGSYVKTMSAEAILNRDRDH